MGLSTEIKKLLLMALMAASMAACSPSSKGGDANNETQNKIKLGVADIEVVCHGDVPADLSAVVGVSSIFDRTFTSEETQLSESGAGRLAGQIEIETPRAIAAFMLMGDADRYAMGYVELSQETPLVIDVTFADGKAVKAVKSNEDGVNANPLMLSPDDKDMMLTDAAYIAASPGYWNKEKQPRLYVEDCADAGKAIEKFDEFRAYVIDQALHGREVPAAFDGWFLTHLNNMIYGDYYLGYREFIENEGAELPIEFFRFLNDIDFNWLLTHDVVTGPNYMMRKMLSSPNLGLKPIGEMPVAEWQAQTKASLGRVMDDVPQLLLDMLSATSYAEQLNANKPLSEAQIENIKAGYGDDLGKLLLIKNERLVSDLNTEVDMADLSGEEFMLQRYIDENFAGLPVVVDTWNTWCMPCMEAHKNVEPLRELPESEGVVFLYVSDVTSPLAEWQRHAPHIGGKHVRISEASRDAMGKTYDLKAFPSYLFFDADHKLNRTVTAYPGDKKFLQYIKEVNPQ